jgi:hypothetical protein
LGGFGGGSSGYITNGGFGGGGAGFGEAVFSMYDSVTVVNSTFTLNTAVGGSVGISGYGGAGLGGAVFNLNGDVSLTNDTLAADSASTDGRELYNIAYGKNPDGTSVNATVTIANSILANATGGTSDLVNNTGAGTATVNEAGPNIIRTSSGAGFSGTAPLTSDPMLAVLGNYGGPTQTLALLPGSPAINAGSNAAVPNGVASDQRGAPRIFNVTVDLGAFESQGYKLVPTNTPQSANPNAAFADPLIVTLTENFANDPLPGTTIVYSAAWQRPLRRAQQLRRHQRQRPNERNGYRQRHGRRSV